MKAKIIFSISLVLSIVAFICCQHMVVYYYNQMESIPLGVESDFPKRAAVTNVFEIFNWATFLATIAAFISVIGLIVSWIQSKFTKRGKSM